jgi:hypothetical protein
MAVKRRARSLAYGAGQAASVMNASSSELIAGGRLGVEAPASPFPARVHTKDAVAEAHPQAAPHLSLSLPHLLSLSLSRSLAQVWRRAGAEAHAQAETRQPSSFAPLTPSTTSGAYHSTLRPHTLAA